MGMIVYGGCVEPEGMELEDNRRIEVCPNCRAAADGWFIEAAESGCLNVYMGLRCYSCGYEEGEMPADP